MDGFIADETENARRAGVAMKKYYKVPPYTCMIFLEDCEQITIRDVSLIESIDWTMHFKWCRRLFVQGVYIFSSLEAGVNADGIDIDGCQDVVISDCIIQTGDDSIVLKSTITGEDYQNCENITVTNCSLVSTSTGLKLGTESFGDFRHITFNNCVIRNSNRGLSIVVRDGGTVSDVLFSDITIETDRKPFFWWGDGDPIWLVIRKRNPDSRIGKIQNVTFQNIIAHGQGTSKLEGFPGEQPLENIRLQNVQLHLSAEDLPDKRATNIFRAHNVNGLFLSDVTLRWDTRQGVEPKWSSALVLEKIDGLEMDRVRARPNDGRDDIAGIQAAIDAAAEAGGGVVWVPKGQFDFDVDSSKGFLHISSSNIVLLGAGEGPDGTLIFDHAPSPTPDPKKPWLAGLFPSFVHVGPTLPKENDSPVGQPELLATTASAARRGDRTLTVDQPDQLEAGRTYVLTQQETADSSLVRALTNDLPKIGVRHLVTNGPAVYKMQQLVHIDKIEGNRVTLDAPLLFPLEERWQPKLWRIPVMLENVVVAGFRLSNDWDEEFYHHLNGEHDNGYNGVGFHFVENGWVQSIIGYSTSALVGLKNSRHCSVFDCQIRGIPGHNGFVIGGASTRNLIYNCRAGNSMHSFAVSGPASGNVFYNCSAGEPSAIDLHSGLGVSNLFDNMFGPVYKHGGNAAGLPPAMGKGHVFWNWKVGRYEPYKGRITNKMWNNRDLPAFIAVGVKGLYDQPLHYQIGDQIYAENIDTLGICIERFNAPVGEPASLFLFQRTRRLGRGRTMDF